MALNMIGRGLDPRQDISIKLEKSHLVYLQTDESPLKLEERRKLEGFIREYLYMVPHEAKYSFPETAHILHRSAATINDFSGYRACSAWTAISLYASNLLSQPWRKEYRTLRTYCGYYKHEIEANLIGAELMFELMNYKHTGLGILTLDDPIDPDQVANVSRDAIIAFVECQIMKQIWERVSETFAISWLEVLQFRENNAGTPDQAVRALLHHFSERLHRDSLKMENHRDYHHTQPKIFNTIPSMAMPYNPVPNNFKTSFAATDVDCEYIDKLNLQYLRPIDSLDINRCSTYGYLSQNNIFPNPAMNYNPCLINNGTSNISRVQSDRIIELDSTPATIINYDKSCYRCIPIHNEHIDDADYGRTRNIVDDCTKIDRKNIRTSVNSDSASHQSWDFVYRSLDNFRYSKDIAEREDILQKKDSSRSKFKSHDKYVSDYYKTRGGKCREVRGDKMSDALHEDNLLKNRLTVNSLESNNSEIKSSNVQQDQMKELKQTFIDQQKNYQKVVGLMDNISIRPKEEFMKKDGQWSCFTCTYLNESKADICEMCGKSKLRGNEDAPLTSGGQECTKCTLINEKDAIKCAACYTNLKNSSTYV